MYKCSFDVFKTLCYLVNFDDYNYNISDVIGYACSNCNFLRSEIPSLSSVHKELRFSELPTELLELNTLERFLARPRIGFIQIRAAHVDQQKKSKGRIVNVHELILNLA